MSHMLYFSRERDRDMCKLTYQLVTQAAAERDVPVMLKDIANDADGAQRYAHVQLPVLRMMDGSEVNGRAAYDKVLDLTGYGVPPSSISRGGITPPQSGAAQPGQFTPPPMIMITPPQPGQPQVGMPGMPPMQCLSTTSGNYHSSRLPTRAIARVRFSISSVVMKLAEAIRNAVISIGE